MRPPDIVLILILIGLGLGCAWVFRSRLAYARKKHRSQADALARWCVNAVKPELGKQDDLPEAWEEKLYDRLRTNFLLQLNLAFCAPVMTVYRTDLFVDLEYALENKQLADLALMRLPSDGFRLSRTHPYTVLALPGGNSSRSIPLGRTASQ